MGTTQSDLSAVEDEPVCSHSVSKSSESPLIAQSDAKDDGREQKSPTESVAGTRPSTPPPRSEAFEQFKRERGSEINKILVLNKGWSLGGICMSILHHFTEYFECVSMYNTPLPPFIFPPLFPSSAFIFFLSSSLL